MPTVPTPVTAAPTAPDRADRSTFNSRATAWADYQKANLVPEINALADNVYDNAVEAASSASNAATSEANAAGSASAAATSESNAATSASNAASSASAAATSEANAAASAAVAQSGAAFVDSNPVVKGSVDPTKQIRFEVDGLTTGTTRVITVPDSNIELVGKDTAQTLTNKTLTAPTITDYTETAVNPSAGSTFTVNLANGTVQAVTTNANTTITIPAPAAGKSFQLQINFGGAHTISFTVTGGSTVRGAAYTPTSASGKLDVLNYVATADGTAWVRSIFAQGV